jgi:hypothetical protein
MIYDVLMFLFGSKDGIDRTAVWTSAIALITAIGVGFAVVQLRSLRKISQADFAKRFNDSFFKSETRVLLTLLMNSALSFDIRVIIEDGKEIDRLPHFPIKPEIMTQISGLVEGPPKGRTSYSGLEIDDMLLLPLDILGWYVKNGFIYDKIALEIFRYYLDQIWENPAIQKYADDEDNAGMYENVRYLSKNLPR